MERVFARGYKLLDSEDIESSLLNTKVEPNGSSSREPQKYSKSAWSRSLYLLLGLNLLLFIGSLSLFMTWYYNQHWVLNARLRRDSTYSKWVVQYLLSGSEADLIGPIFDRIDLESRPMPMNGTLFPPKHPSIGREFPHPETDTIWEGFGDMRVFPVTRADIIRMGNDPSTVAKLEDDVWGLGDDAYATVFDIYHQLHCLFQLKKAFYAPYYNVSAGNAVNATGMYEIHVNHCLDVVYQALICAGNVNLIALHWTETQKYPYPDLYVPPLPQCSRTVAQACPTNDSYFTDPSIGNASTSTSSRAGGKKTPSTRTRGVR